MQRCPTRRTFVKATGAATLGGFALHAPLVRAASPNGKLSHASIGVGGMMGPGNWQNIKSHPRAEIVAICDVDQKHLAAAAVHMPDSPKYTDWREMLANEGDKIDSVNVTVPDHMHAPMTLTALKAGKHVYCQKPLCHDVAECRAVAEAAKAYGRITQLGTQAASGAGDRMAVEYLRSGVLGRVKKVIVCSNRPGAIANYRPVGPRPDKTDSVPGALKWDLWLGSAPERPFVSGVYHPVKWRGWQDFGTGWLGDIGCHVFDSWWKGLRLTAPKSVIAEVQESWRDSPERRADTWPQSVHVTWTFDGNEASGGQDFTVEWFDGLMFPPTEAQEMAKAAGFSKFPAESSMVVGEKGSMIVPNGAGPRFSPKDKFKDIPRLKLPPRNHYHHFVDACLGGEKTESFFEQTGPMTEAILLGTVAIRVPGRKLTWDAVNMKFPNAPEAERFLRRRYRDGWAVEGVA